MSEIEKLIDKVLQDNTTLNIETIYYKQVKKMFLEFGKQVCDLQIKECADVGYYKTLENGEVVELWEITNRREILETKNICD